MRSFLYDKGVEYSYEQLLADVSSARSYFPLYRYDNVYDFFKNFVIALVGVHDLILLDADINPSELEDLDKTQINVSTEIVASGIHSMREMVERIQNSKSRITIFTSGTTGQPKKVVHTVQTLTRNTRVNERHTNDVWGFCYNPTHMAGLQVFFQAFENCNKLVNIFNSMRDDVYDAIEKNQITHLSATPTFYRLLLPVQKPFDCVQRVTFGGEKSDGKLYDSITRIFPKAKVTNIYASTEAGSLFAARGEFFLIPKELKDKFKVEEGELLIHKSLLGYSESFRFKDDFYCSGDLIEWVNEEDGLFKFVSRKNSMINVGGYKVNPEEVESVIKMMDGVQEVLVWGKMNSILGNVLCADVKLEAGKKLTEFDIRQYLKDKLQDFKIPRRIKFVDVIELTRTGKLKRK